MKVWIPGETVSMLLLLHSRFLVEFLILLFILLFCCLNSLCKHSLVV